MKVLQPEQAIQRPGLAGGKAVGLARIVEIADVVVPEFFVISSAESVAHLGRLELIPAALSLQDEVERLSHEEIATQSRALQETIAESELHSALSREVEIALGELGDGPFAVRSSMVGEDSQKASFAGQLSSFLFQTDLAHVKRSIVHAWASAFTPHLMIYRARHGFAGLPRVGVIVQKMVDGQVSGVAFGADPRTGHRDHVLINANWGLAEGVVSGACNADEFLVDTSHRELESTVARKDRMITASVNGVEEVAVPEERQEVRCLNEEEVVTIARAVRRLGEAFEGPQDVEWTLRQNRLIILQSRPITALPAPENVDGPVVVFDNSNIQESYCGVTTPLTFSFARAAYASVYTQTMQALRIPAEVIAAHDDMLRNMLGLINGRIYYNINNWYRGLLLLPSFGQNKQDMEAMMGLEDPVDFVVDEDLSFGEKLARLPGLLRAFYYLLKGFRGLDRSVGTFLDDFQKGYLQVDRARFADATFSELMEAVLFIEDELMGHWTTPIINDFYVMMTMGKVRRMLEEAGIDNAKEVANNLLSGEEGIESVEPTRILMRMAKDAADHPGLLEELKNDNPGMGRIHELAPSFASRIEEYIERYGDRVIGELKLETITLREDRRYLFQILKNFLSRQDLDPDRLADSEKRTRASAEELVYAKVRPSKARKAIEKARTAVKNRENLRFARTRLFGLARDAYRAIGSRLYEAGKLNEPRDIFYLTTDEILAYHEGRAVTTNFSELVDLRKREFASYESIEMPHHFQTRGPVYHGNRIQPRRVVDSDLPTMQGTGCYPGVVEAPLRVIMSPSDNLSLEGQILTTLRTDPGWTPLFPAASGILVERGSTLSHSAVVARELGIPAVVGVKDLLATIKDGERVRLDGSTGVIERLEHNTGL